MPQQLTGRAASHPGGPTAPSLARYSLLSMLLQLTPFFRTDYVRLDTRKDNSFNRRIRKKEALSNICGIAESQYTNAYRCCSRDYERVKGLSTLRSNMHRHISVVIIIIINSSSAKTQYIHCESKTIGQEPDYLTIYYKIMLVLS